MEITAIVAATVSGARVNGGQCFGGFSGGIARERTNFGRRPEMYYEQNYNINCTTHVQIHCI